MKIMIKNALLLTSLAWAGISFAQTNAKVGTTTDADADKQSQKADGDISYGDVSRRG